MHAPALVSLSSVRPRLPGLLALVAAFAIAVLAQPPVAQAQEIDEGIDYRLVSQPMRAEPGDDVEVLEFFWYGCPHCYHLEPEIDRWLESKPEGVTFLRVPAASSPRWVPHAKAYYAAEMLGELDKLHEPLFKALHEQRRRIFTDEEIIAFAAEQGIDEDACRKAYNSFPVDMQVRKSADLVQRYGIDGVPTVVINGKYVTSATQTGSNAKMFDVIDYLVDQEMKLSAAQKGASGAKPEPSGG